MHAYMNKCEGTKRLFILNHFTVSVILFGKLPQIARQGLRKVSKIQKHKNMTFTNVITICNIKIYTHRSAIILLHS